MIEYTRATALIDWYWQHGIRRPLPPDSGDGGGGDREKYRLPVDQWLARLYNVRDQLRDLGEALQPRRPALALWGLSQTGKSTALGFVDGNIHFSRDGVEGEDGQNGGLHWPGGSPFIYQPPLRNPAPDFWHGCAYNPFNGEDDGSACLTRLIAGQNHGEEAVDPRHPALVRLLKPVELLNTIARGYDTQCLGPEKAGRHTPWTVSTLEARIDIIASRFASAAAAAEGIPDRTATERVLRLIATVEDLYAVRVATFSKLADDAVGLRQLLDRLLLQRDAFVCSPPAADAITAEILWGGAEFVSSNYHRLRAWHDKLIEAWGDRKVRATLQTAMLFVDFGSGINRLKGNTTAARQSIQGRLIQSLGYRIEDQQVLLGSGADYTHHLGSSALEFAMTQALVWELVLPVNMQHLSDEIAAPLVDQASPSHTMPNAGKRLLERADILDFPGVGKDEVNETARLNLGVGNLPGGKRPDPTDFFSKILKRGKTASVVANYATRRNIDSFAILQSLKGDIAPSAEMVGQIMEGCESWARFAGYPTGPEAESPLPLHFILTFWGLKAANFRAGTSGNFQNGVGKMIESYGWVRTRSTAWALNYHWFRTPEGESLSSVDLKRFAHGTEDYHAVTREREFVSAFGNPISRASFDSMLQDRATGGLAYFLTTVAGQLAQIDMSARRNHLIELISTTEQQLALICAFPYLRPPNEEVDARIEILSRFRLRIIEAAAPFNEAQTREVSHALREFVNVDPEQLPYPPLDPEQIDSTYIDRLFFVWREAQQRRYDDSGSPTAGNIRWSHLRFQGREEFGETLQALTECLGEKVFTSIASGAHRWLRSLRGHQPDYQTHHLRRYLAIEMVNWLCYFFPDPEQPEARRRVSPERDARWKFPWPEAIENHRARTPCMQTRAWAQFPGPFLDEHLAYVLGTKSKKPERPALPGDDDLSILLPARV